MLFRSIDNSGYVPRIARASAELLRDAGAAYARGAMAEALRGFSAALAGEAPPLLCYEFTAQVSQQLKLTTDGIEDGLSATEFELSVSRAEDLVGIVTPPGPPFEKEFTEKQ